MIFIHGSGENSNVWKNQFKLNINYNLTRIDLPSHSKSEEFSTLTLELYVNIIKELEFILDFEKIILCGHSLGGAVALSYYLKFPDKVESLVLIGTGARLRVSPLIFKSLKSNFEEYLESIKVGAFYRKTEEKIINDFINEVKKTNPGVIHTDFSICDQFDILSEIKAGKIKIPSLIICGKNDMLTPLKYSIFFQENIENSNLIVINNSGHMVMLEKPEEVNLAIQKFI